MIRKIPSDEEIPFEDIDKEMQPLVKAMNDVGLKTFGCCEGHSDHGRKLDAYIAFTIGNGSMELRPSKSRGPLLVLRWDRTGKK